MVKGEADGQQTVTGLTPGQGYYFIVIAGRPQATGGGMQWSSWSNWAAAKAGVAASTPTPTPAPTSTASTSTFPANPVNGDYDFDNDGRIEIRTIAQLQAIRHDLDGNGAAAEGEPATAYAVAFPNAATGMGCPDAGCAGYELTRDLDFLEVASADAWTPVGDYDNPFAADFDGNGHVISNLSISARSAYYVGLFGVTGTGSNIQRVGLEDANVVGKEGVGGLVGINGGSIAASYVTGTVLATSGGRTGGLVGINRGPITTSYASVNVSGLPFAGGLVGKNDGAITASYSTGDASGSTSGGLVGKNEGIISTSYSTGEASGYYARGGLNGYGGGTITNSYWDTTTSGLTTSVGGVGKTTIELQAPTSATSIYSNWSGKQWDFGTSSQYPVLKVSGLSVAAQRGQATAAQPGGGSVIDRIVDRAALVAFYQATGGANWKDIPGNEQWLINDPGSPISNWHGVTTNDAGRVQTIWLPDKGLKGELPAELADLSALTTLYLSRNRLSGEIPAELGSLSNLWWLDLSHNADRGKFGYGAHPGFSGALPMEMGNLHNLRYLDLNGNSFEGDPTEVLLNIAQCNTNGACRNEATFIDIELRDNSWSGEERDFWLNFTGKVVQVARGEFGDPYKNFIGKNADSVIKAFLNHEALAGKYSRFNAWATITEGAIGKANFAAEIVDPLGLFGQDATVQAALWDVFILNKDWADVRTEFLTSWGVAPENICWGGLVSANCMIYESLDSDVEWCKAIYGERAAHCNQ